MPKDKFFRNLLRNRNSKFQNPKKVSNSKVESNSTQFVGVYQYTVPKLRNRKILVRYCFVRSSVQTYCLTPIGKPVVHIKYVSYYGVLLDFIILGGAEGTTGTTTQRNTDGANNNNNNNNNGGTAADSAARTSQQPSRTTDWGAGWGATPQATTTTSGTPRESAMER